MYELLSKELQFGSLTNAEKAEVRVQLGLDWSLPQPFVWHGIFLRQREPEIDNLGLWDEQ
jgi:hypothetical protein